MIDWMFLVFIIIAIFFMILAIEFYREENDLWCFILTLVDGTVWYLLAASVLEIERPYEIYNVSMGAIETGTHIVTSKVAPEMVLFFMLMGSIMMIFWLVQIFIYVYEAIFKKPFSKRYRRLF